MTNASRAFCLYRVSLTRQADRHYSDGKETTDIPMQKEACRQFCQDHGWEIVNSYTETGVSAYKNATFERDAIKTVFEEAKKGNFDILLIYAIDRLSRRDFELPLLVSKLKEIGIRIWSIQEGELAFDSSTDHLLLFLLGWKAFGESERTGQRIATVQHQIVQRGEFRGGTVPYGYKLIESGEISKQGRVRHILAIHEPEAAVIRMIFRMTVEDGFSMYELTRYLSTMELPPDTRKLVWRSSSLHVMLRNRIYIGQQRIKSTYSLPFDRLQIIQPDTFWQVQKIIKMPKEKASPEKTEKVDPPLLYHDLVFCGDCGGHLVYNHAFDKLKDGSYSLRYYYRCYNRERFSNPCTGASTFSANRIDAAVREKTMNLISFLLSSPAESLVRNSAELARAEYLARRDELRLKLAELDNRLEVLQKQLTVSLRQFGVEATAELQLVYADVHDKQKSVSFALQQMKPAHYEIDRLIANKRRVFQKILKECELWSEKEWKQAEKMTFRFFERIDVYQGYHLYFTIVPEIRQFLPVTFLSGNWIEKSK